MTETRGKDFNYFEEISISGVGSYPTEPQAQIKFRGARKIMLVGKGGTDVEYSFNGTTTHGKISNGEVFNFGTRGEDKIFFKGTGDVHVHAWHVGV